MVTIARTTSCSVASRNVAKRCGSAVWSMTLTVEPSGSSQIVRMGLPSTFMAALLTRFALRQKRCRCRRDTHQTYRESADGAPQLRPEAGPNLIEHATSGRRWGGLEGTSWCDTLQVSLRLFSHLVQQRRART